MAMGEGPATEFGALLRRHRVAAGLTQEGLAERARLSPRGVQDLERGVNRAPRRDTLELLSAGLGLAEPERVALQALATRRHSPPALPHGGPPHNLLSSPTGLVGRERDTVAVCALLRQDDVRLLTLRGPAGVGKTRLGLDVALAVRDSFADGVFFVALAQVGAPRLVVPAIAQALGVREQGGRPLREALEEHLRGKRLLLLLDNFEHLAAAAPAVADLLATCPAVTILVTSRAALHVRGERAFPVGPLALPDADAAPPPSPEDVARSPAVDLFLRRARDVLPDFRLTAANAPTVVAICRRLDGLPLALELAAARVALLPPRTMLARLEHPLRVLTGGPCDVPARQQTLRAAIVWSHDLLDPAEQAVFRRLAACVGGCTLAAAEAICGAGAGSRGCDEAGTEADDVLEGLAALVDKSMVRQEGQADGEARFTMLATIREYALERLAASGEAEAVGRAHADYYLALAEEAEPRLTGPEQALWLARLEMEGDNLRGALRWARDGGEVARGVRLAGALWRFWYVRGHLSEGRAWLDGLLALTTNDEGPDAAVRAKALTGAGVLANIQGDYDRATALCEESLTLYRGLGDKQGMAVALNILGDVAVKQGDYERAVALSEDSLALQRERGDKRGIAVALNNLGSVVQNHHGDYGRAVVLFEESLALFQDLGEKRGIALLSTNLGEVARYRHDYRRAATLLEESLILARELGDTWIMGITITYLADVARDQNNHEQANTLYREGLALYQTMSDKVGIAGCLEGVAGASCMQGQMERAARLFGAAATLRNVIGAPLSPIGRTTYDHTVAATREALGEITFAAAWAAGQALPLEQAVVEAATKV